MSRKRAAPSRLRAEKPHRLRALVGGLLGLLGRYPGRGVMVALAVLATSTISTNALLKQTARHPAPMFGAFPPPPLPPAAPAREAAPAAASAEDVADAAMIREVQAGLARAGFYDGPVDGVNGPRTVLAIEAFERAQHLPERGDPTPLVLARLRQASPGVPLPRPKAAPPPRAAAGL
jgi:hypothetical protein